MSPDTRNWILGSHNGEVLDLKFDPADATRLVSVSSDQTVRLWDVSARRMVGESSFAAPVFPSALEWSSSSDELFVGFSNGTICLMNSATLQCYTWIDTHGGRVTGLKLRADALVLASMSNESMVRLWERS